MVLLTSFTKSLVFLLCLTVLGCSINDQRSNTKEMLVSDLECVHRSLELLLDSSPFEASYQGILSRTTKREGIRGAPQHAWQIYNSNTHELSSTVILRLKSDAEWADTSSFFSLGSVDVGVRGREILAEWGDCVLTLESLEATSKEMRKEQSKEEQETQNKKQAKQETGTGQVH